MSVGPAAEPAQPGGFIGRLDAMHKLGHYDSKSDMYTRSLVVNGKRLSLYEDPSGADIHGEYYITEASIVLARFLDNPDYFPDGWCTGRRAVELGSGPGLLGLAVGAHGCEIALTDRGIMMELLAKNLDHNRAALGGLGHVRVVELNWGQGEEGKVDPPVDFVFASDVTYNPDTYPLFIRTLTALCGPATKFFLAHERRWKNDPSRETLFFTMMTAARFTTEKIDPAHLDPDFRSDVIDVYLFQKQPAQ